jgi:predicted RNA-binding Zn ribbon-like protein
VTAAKPPAQFIADALGLDFLNSIATPVDVAVEWLGNGVDLLDWLRQANLVPDDVRATLQSNAVPGELDAVAGQARALREWFREFVHRHRGKPLRASALEQLGPLNRILARDEEFGQILVRDRSHGEAASSGLEWHQSRRWRSPDALLLPIARAMADLVCTEDFALIKPCEGMKCTLFFLDRTHGHGRRWCNMAVCGNRAKQLTHRSRRRRS